MTLETKTNRIIFSGAATKSLVSIAAWAYYIAKRIPVSIPKGTSTHLATEPDAEPRISGVGQHDDRQPRIPPPGYDISNIAKGPLATKARKGIRRLNLREFMTGDQRKEWKDFEPLYLPG